MRAGISAIFMAAMLLASVGAASAAGYVQASSTDEQLASDPKPKVVTMNSTDAAKNIKQDKGVITVNESGAYFLIAAAQVGGKTKGLVRMWMRINGKDVEVGPRYSVTSQLKPVRARDPGEFTGGIWEYLYPPRPSTFPDRKSTRLNSSHRSLSRMPSSA